MARQPRITVLQLDPGVPLARFDGWLKAAGVRLSTVTLWDRDVPPLASAGDGLLVLGGRMSATSRAGHPWLDELGVPGRRGVGGRSGVEADAAARGCAQEDAGETLHGS